MASSLTIFLNYNSRLFTEIHQDQQINKVYSTCTIITIQEDQTKSRRYLDCRDAKPIEARNGNNTWTHKSTDITTR